MMGERRANMPEQNPPADPAQPDNSHFVAEYTTVHSIFVRHRNCLLLRADFAPIFVDFYLHLMQHALSPCEVEAGIFKQLLAYFTLHLVSRPWQEHHAWTLNVKTPTLANYFVAGSSLTEDVVGRIYTEDVREPESNILYAQNISRNKEMQTSVIPLGAGSPAEWVEEFYSQSEQRQARAFELEGDSYALITAQPGADTAWLAGLTAQEVARLAEQEELHELETRRFTFRCGCSVERILPAVRAMHRDFADILAEQGYIEASCPRCGVSYRITPEMLSGSDTTPDACC